MGTHNYFRILFNIQLTCAFTVDNSLFVTGSLSDWSRCCLNGRQLDTLRNLMNLVIKFINPFFGLFLFSFFLSPFSLSLALCCPTGIEVGTRLRDHIPKAVWKHARTSCILILILILILANGQDLDLECLMAICVMCSEPSC